MNPRKRHAREILPTTRPVKIARMSTTDNAIEENPSLGARWYNLGKEALKLGRETLWNLIPSLNLFPFPLVPPQPRPRAARRNARARRRPHPPPPAANILPASGPPHSNVPSSSGTGITAKAPSANVRHPQHYLDIPNLPQDPRAAQQMRTRAPPAPNSVPAKVPPMAALPNNAVSSAPRHPESQASGSKLPTTSGPDLLLQERTPSRFKTKFPTEKEAKLTSETRKQEPPRPKKTYQEREHIFAKQFKAEVRAAKKREIEEQAEELYRQRRASGYRSDFTTFKGLLTYQAKLAQQAQAGQRLRSPSLTDLRPKVKEEPRRRLHSESYPEGLRGESLDRALRKAKDALHGPKPPKPFVPSIERLRIAEIAQDREIDRRLHPSTLPGYLVPEEENKVGAILGRRGEVSKFGREQVQDRDIARLRPGQWLNDEIINFYGAMLQGRSQEAIEKLKVNGSETGAHSKPWNVHYFSTFFWPKLRSSGYEKGRLSKWTKKLDIFTKDIILIPINHNNTHWSAAAINFRQKRIEYYDSMSLEAQKVFTLLRTYVDLEHQTKRNAPFDFTGWEDYSPEAIPQQENCYDCGVFTCQFLEALSRGEHSFNFNQSNMPYLRKRMILEIGNAKLS